MGIEQDGFSSLEQEEAEKFNQMVGEGKLTPTEASRVEKDKTPEEVEAEKEALAKVMAVNEFGQLVHGTRGLNEETLSDILTNGLKTSRQIERQRLEKMTAEERKEYFKRRDHPLAAFGRTFYEDHISTAMNGILVSGLNGNPAKAFGGDYMFIINPDFVRELIETDAGKLEKQLRESGYFNRMNFATVPSRRSLEPIWIIGMGLAGTFGFDKDEEDSSTGKKARDYFQRAGWIDAAVKSGVISEEHDFTWLFASDLAHEYASSWGEVLIHEPLSDSSEYREQMVRGLAVPEEKSDRIIGLMKEIVRINPKVAIPIYDHSGNLLWPKIMRYEEVKQKSEDIKKKNEESQTNE